MWYIFMYYVFNICLIRYDFKIYDIYILLICINLFNCLNKWKFEMWKNFFRFKLFNLLYIFRVLILNDIKEI